MATDDGKRRTLWTVFWVLFGALPLVAGLPSCGGVPDEEDGRAIGAAFLDQIREGRVDEAWGGTTSEFKSMLGLEGLRAYVAKHPELASPAEFEGLEEIEQNDLTLAKCRFRAAASGEPITVLLAREAGEWKVERLTPD